MISVPSQDTLDRHIQGKDHIKKERRLQTERQELQEAKEMIEVLEGKVKENDEKLALCRQVHSMSKKELHNEVVCCQQNHRTDIGH